MSAGGVHIKMVLFLCAGMPFVISASADVPSNPECVHLQVLGRSAASAGERLDATKIPSVDAKCVEAWNAFLSFGVKHTGYQSLCASECRSLQDLVGRCTGGNEAEYYFGLLCGRHGGVHCSVLYGTPSFSHLMAETRDRCNGSLSACGNECGKAAEDLYGFAGCCIAPFQLKAFEACGMAAAQTYCQPIYGATEPVAPGEASALGQTNSDAALNVHHGASSPASTTAQGACITQLALAVVLSALYSLNAF